MILYLFDGLLYLSKQKHNYLLFHEINVDLFTFLSLMKNYLRNIFLVYENYLRYT